MTGSDAAKSLSVAAVIVFVAGLGAMMFPIEARYARAGYSAALALALAIYVFFGQPRQNWVRRPFVFFSAVFALIGTILLIDG